MNSRAKPISLPFHCFGLEDINIPFFHWILLAKLFRSGPESLST